MSKLAEKLQRLLVLATLKEGEDRNEARVNEARTAAFLLIKTVQDNGVKLRFQLPADARPAEALHAGFAHTGFDGFSAFYDDYLRRAAEAARAREDQARREAFKRPRKHRGARVQGKDVEFKIHSADGTEQTFEAKDVSYSAKSGKGR